MSHKASFNSLTDCLFVAKLPTSTFTMNIVVAICDPISQAMKLAGSSSVLGALPPRCLPLSTQIGREG